ncbi:NAD(P)-binding protein [Periconia macrospinosa]|uniref:NAD(P)-binding protein n=1 Tax=Periconia macrospinosa TaxID=97972 RepID=A0A2V1EG24_9PLEO|nr:NAD(P)-binding protein [Periconia macrospinosa]
MANSSLRVGWIGLGSMGLAMATNMQKHLQNQELPPLQYTNRTLSRGDSLKAIGGIPCQTAVEVVQNSDMIFISVSDDAALTATIQTILQTQPQLSNKILLDTTTVHPNTTSSITKLLTEAGAQYIAAPVFGATPTAQAGQLLMALGGPEPAISTAQPYLVGVLARGTIPVGPEPSKALLLKSTSNFITAGLMYLLSEAHVLAEVSDLPAQTLESLIEQNFGAYAGGVSKRITSGSYVAAEGERPSSGLALGIKDVGIGVGIAKEKGLGLKVGELSLEAMERAKRWGEERGKEALMDSSSVFGSVRAQAGLEFESEVVKRRDGKE